jgi:hypothetical protein
MIMSDLSIPVLSSEEDVLTTYRHFEMHPDIWGHRSSGVTLRIDLDYGTRCLQISFSRCSKKDVYDEAVGENLCDERMRQGKFYEGFYNPSLDLKTNALLVLSNYIEENFMTKDKHHNAKLWNTDGHIIEEIKVADLLLSYTGGIFPKYCL